MNAEKLVSVLKSHAAWLNGDVGKDVRRADLRSTDLRGTDLRGANLVDADLRWADLRWADLRGTNLCGADLYEADLRCADLRGAKLMGALFAEADLRGARLAGTALRVIYGSRDVVYYTGMSHIQIGCITQSLLDWAMTYEEIGAHAEYTPDEITEYGRYIHGFLKK